MVTSGLLRFYAGTPIISSKGHRLGTVCFASGKPRKFDAEGCNMLVNMCELVTRELERDWVEDLQSKAMSSKPQASLSCVYRKTHEATMAQQQDRLTRPPSRASSVVWQLSYLCILLSLDSRIEQLLLDYADPLLMRCNS